MRVFWLLKCFQSSVFWIFKLSRVNSVYEFPKLSPQLQIKSFKNSWRIDFFFFLIISCGKNRNIYEKKCSLRQSSREQKRKKRVHSMFTRGKLSRPEESSKIWKSKQNYFIINTVNYIDCNCTRTQNHLVRKRALNHLAKLAKWLSCVANTYQYGPFDCIFLSCHVRFQSESTLYSWLNFKELLQAQNYKGRCEIWS